MCTHFRSYLRGAQFTFVQTTVPSVGCRSSIMRMECWPAGICCWDNADGKSRQGGQCQRPDCPVSSSDSLVADADSGLALVEQPFASSEMGDFMDAERNKRSCLGPCLGGGGGDGQDRCLLSLMGLVLMAVFSWQCMCNGRRACWCLLIG